MGQEISLDPFVAEINLIFGQKCKLFLFGGQKCKLCLFGVRSVNYVFFVLARDGSIDVLRSQGTSSLPIPPTHTPWLAIL